MEISIIKIGNSRGFRLSKSILDRYNISDKVELILEKGQIVLRPVNKPRKGWDEAFSKMHQNGDDQLQIDDVFEDESQKDWR
ncbi:MAG: AbrB/MazE/SpoVT family DNA-binding domain-containing protein [Flavobacteriales bacterium]|nr:AbrB/MazE/SpoVT family DNA-binding domain-containing protein [Flavobacteriales bacterium]